MMACEAAASPVNTGDVMSTPDDGSKGKSGYYKKRKMQVVILQNNQHNLSSISVLPQLYIRLTFR